MSLGLMHTNLVVKNTFLEFDLKDSAWQSASRRRASVDVSFVGSAKGKQGDRDDNCDLETGSTTGSEHQSLLASIETESLADVNLCGDVNTPQCFYSSEWDDWDPPNTSEEFQQMQSSISSSWAELATRHIIASPMQGLEPYLFCSEPPPSWFQSQPSFFATTPSNAVTSMSAVPRTGSIVGAECPYVATQRTSQQHESLSSSPKSVYVQSAVDSRQCEHLSYSPRRKQVPERSTPSSPKKESEYTTVMLRNLPNDYTRDMLEELLQSRGLGGCYDFLYLPFDFKRGAGLGYAFVNMITHEDALHAMNDLAGFRTWKLRSGKVLQVTWSTPLQGLLANIERYRNSPVMHPDVPEQFKPLLVSNGSPIDFPAPTKPLPNPNLSQN